MECLSSTPIALENLGLQKKGTIAPAQTSLRHTPRPSEDRHRLSCAMREYKCKCMGYAWSLKLDILKFDTHVIYLKYLYLATLSMYCSHQTCDHTNNKIIKKSMKGKLLIKHQILGHKEFREAAISNPVTGATASVWRKCQGSLDTSLRDCLWYKNYRPLGGRVSPLQATLQQMIGDTIQGHLGLSSF